MESNIGLQCDVVMCCRVHKQLATTWKDCMQVIENFGRNNFVNFLNKNAASKVSYYSIYDEFCHLM